jgi:hypothetical protein
MDLITRGLATGLLIWLALLGVVMVARVLNGDISGTGFLHTTRGTRARVAPERVVSMMVFPMVIVSYIFSAMHADVNVPHPSLPDLSDNLLMLLAGGNGVYLAGKIARLQ